MSQTKAGPKQKHKTLSEKYLKRKRVGDMAQVAKHLPTKHEALSSNSTTYKRKKKFKA
jgi:hypothetical protein